MNILKAEKEFWNRNARKFNEVKYETKNSKKEAKSVIIHFKERVGKINRLLELGGGSGRFTVFLEQAFPKSTIFSLDISREMQKIAKENCKKTNFILGDARSIPFKNNYLDFVFCAGILHHLINYSEGLDEAVRVAKKNGYMLFYEPNSEYVYFRKRFRIPFSFLKPVRDFLFKKNNLKKKAWDVRYDGSPAEAERFKKFGTTTINPVELITRLKKKGLTILYVKKSVFAQMFEILARKNGK